MELLTEEIKKTLPALYSQQGKKGKAIAHIKFFTPDSNWTWYVLEGESIYDPGSIEQDYHFFGLVDGLERELGYFSLKDLKSAKGPMGLAIERDLHWEPKTLEEIAPELFETEDLDE